MVTTKRGVTVRITMGQAFKDDLAALVKLRGGRVWSARLDETSTGCEVVATFYRLRTTEQVQDLVWQEWPMCSVGVQLNSTSSRRRRNNA